MTPLIASGFAKTAALFSAEWVVPVVALLVGFATFSLLHAVAERSTWGLETVGFPSLRGLFVAPPARRSAAERRREVRHRGHAVSVTLVNRASEDEAFHGWMIDRSPSGVRLAVTRRLPVGTRLSVKPTAAPDDAAWIDVKVRNQRETDTGWEIGCEVSRQASPETVAFLG